MEEGVIILNRWWSYLIRGIIAIIVGVMLLAWTGATARVIADIVGLFAILDGLVNVILSIMRAVDKEKWVGTLIWGLVGILIGGIIISRPAVLLTIIVVLVGLWAIIMGIVMLVGSVEMPPHTGRGWVGLLGILSVGLGIIILAYPYGSVYAAAVLIGIYALVVGCFDIFLAFYTMAKKHEIEKAMKQAA